MWFENSFRRHLLDMHITDWDDGVFLSEFSPEKYYENLKRANVKSAMIYLQSHVGYCYYPTKTGVMHPAFEKDPDAMKRLIDMCHEGGIDVVAYYSINYNTIESKRHSDWSMVRAGGIEPQPHMFSGGRYGVCCPNNPDYLQFMLDQTTEILEYADMDGIFYDMPFWMYPCHCEHCKRRYKEEFGKELPEGANAKGWKQFLFDREKWADEYLSKLNAHAKKIKPDISVQFNYAYAVLNALDRFGSECVNKYQEYASGDIYGSFFRHSFACKVFAASTNMKPFENMTGRCDPGLSSHTITKSPDRFRLATMLTTAHHGANFVIDAIDPVGTMDSRFYDKLGKQYKEVEHYEPYLKTGEMIEDVGLFYIMEARSDQSTGSDGAFCHYNATLQAATTLANLHIPYGILTQDKCDNIDKHKIVVLSNPVHLRTDTLQKIKAYVEKGGTLYVSGGEQAELLELIGTKQVGTTKQDSTYIAPLPQYEELFNGFNSKYPLAMRNCILPIVEKPEDAEIMATITLPYIHPNPEYTDAFASIHSNPPGTPTDYPAVVFKSYGKGKIIWSVASIEALGYYDHQNVFANLLELSGVDYTVKSNASDNLELISFADEKEVLISAIYVTDSQHTEIQRPFEISIKTKVPAKVTLLRDGSDIEFSYKDGYTTFTTKELNIFDMYQIKF